MQMFNNEETIFYGKDLFYNVPVHTLSKIKNETVENKVSKVVNTEVEYPKGSEYYDKIKFLLIQLVIVGVIPVCKPGPGWKIRFCLIFLYCAPVYVILTRQCWFEFKRIYEESKHITNVENSVTHLNRLWFLSQQFLFLFCVWPQSIYMVRNLHQWSEYQDQYERVTQQPFKLCNINNCLKFSFVSIFIVIPISWDYYRDLDVGLLIGFWETILYCYLTHTATLLVLVWYFIARAGEICTQDFLQQLTQKFNKSVLPSELQAYRLLWLKLSEVVCEGGAILSIPIAQLIFGLFFNIVVYSYIIVLNIVNSIQLDETQYRIFYKSIMAQICIVGSFFIICHKGYTVSQQSQVIKRHLMDMRIPNTVFNQAAMTEILLKCCTILIFKSWDHIKPLSRQIKLRIFMRTVNSFPLEFSIRGFKVVNNATFAAILGDVVTYIIILVQFNLSLQSGSVISNSTSADVSTGKNT